MLYRLNRFTPCYTLQLQQRHLVLRYITPCPKTRRPEGAGQSFDSPGRNVGSINGGTFDVDAGIGQLGNTRTHLVGRSRSRMLSSV